MFEVLSAKTSDSVHINADDLNLRSCSIKGPRTFSIASDSACRAGDIRYYPFRTSFVVLDRHSSFPFRADIIYTMLFPAFRYCTGSGPP